MVEQRASVDLGVVVDDAVVPRPRLEVARLEAEHAVELRRDVELVVHYVPVVVPFGRCSRDQSEALLSSPHCFFGRVHVALVGTGEKHVAFGQPPMANDDDGTGDVAGFNRAVPRRDMLQALCNQCSPITRAEIAPFGSELKQRVERRTGPT